MTTLAPDTLVSIRDLTKTYVQRRAFSGTQFTIEALRGLNLEIRRASTLALVGESGAGKSTLARCLGLLERPSAGEIWFDRVNVLALDRRQLFPVRRRIQLVFQDPASALNSGMTAAEILEEPLLIQYDLTKAERHRRALDLLDEVELPASSAEKRPLDFSGGQRQRLAIARALMLRPELLILDEALSNLDLATRDSIVDLLDALQAEQGLTLVHVLHELRLASQLASDVAVMFDGQIVEHGSADRLFSRPEHPCTRALLRGFRSSQEAPEAMHVEALG